MSQDGLKNWVTNFYGRTYLPNLLKSLSNCLEKGKVVDFESDVQFVLKSDDPDAAGNYWQVICSLGIKGRKDEITDDEDDELTDLLHIDFTGEFQKNTEYLLEDTGFVLDDYQGIIIKIGTR